MTAARSQPRLMSVDSDPMKNACHEKPIFTRTMSPFGDLYNLYVLIALSSLPRSFFDPGPYRVAGPFRTDVTATAGTKSASAGLRRFWRRRSLRSRQVGNETFALNVSRRFARRR